MLNYDICNTSIILLLNQYVEDDRIIERGCYVISVITFNSDNKQTKVLGKVHIKLFPNSLCAGRHTHVQYTKLQIYRQYNKYATTTIIL